MIEFDSMLKNNSQRGIYAKIDMPVYVKFEQKILLFLFDYNKII